MIVVVAILSLLVGVIIGVLWMKTKVAPEAARAKMLEETLRNTKTEHEAQLKREHEYAEEMLQAAKESVAKTAAEQLATKQNDLQTTNRQQIAEMLRPVKEKFDEFEKAVNESRTQTEVTKKEVLMTFEQAVKDINEQTSRIGEDATNLTKALKGESKTQGDWGEMILETVLEQSGLQRDVQYSIQENVKDDDGRNYRPDVIVHLPDGRDIIVDSKVSLTAYADAVSAENDEQRDMYLREHVRSLRRHVDELAEKDYSALVQNAIGYVLMFVPNENSYIAAMNQQRDLSSYAYQRHVIIISPSNLLMALQLAYNLWQADKQSKNVTQVIKAAKDLYDKVAGFSDSFTEIETQISKLQQTYAEARNRLYDGKGNVMRRVEKLRDLGVTTEKSIKGIE